MPDSTSDEFLDAADVAAMFKKPLSTIYRWRSVDYGPPAVKVGKTLLWRRSDVIAWFEHQLAAVTAKSA